jgi:hypothetical protein
VQGPRLRQYGRKVNLDEDEDEICKKQTRISGHYVYDQTSGYQGSDCSPGLSLRSNVPRVIDVIKVKQLIKSFAPKKLTRQEVNRLTT